ncbi:MAG: hypothetical protein ACPGJI_09590, partial [Kangiellaceae bacterium]
LQVTRADVNFNQWLSSFIELLQTDFENNELVIDNLVTDDIELLTDFSWFTECCVDLIRFLLAFDASADLSFNSYIESIGVDSERPSPSTEERVIININSEQVELNTDQQKWLFTPFYSSRLLLGEKDIGLAKVKGFFDQTDAYIDWDNESGFTIEIPISSS